MELMTITQAAKVKNVTRQAIYLAIKQGRLKAYRNGKLQKVSLQGLLAYESHKCSRLFSEFNGQKIYDDSKGLMSISTASTLTGIGISRLYYAASVGHLKAEKKGCAWVVFLEDVIEFNKNFKPKPASKKLLNLEKQIQQIKNLSK